MNKIVQLERKNVDLTSDIEDVLHATSINFSALCTEAQHGSINIIHNECSYLQKLLSQLQNLVKDRSPLFMGYLITRQIQDQQMRVRRERLTEYEEKIYDQKRIITDKETFFESLLRPKRKRSPSQTLEDFQEMRARERENEERFKIQQLTKEVCELKAMNKLLQDQEHCKKPIELQCTKSSSISQVNMTLGEVGDPLTERIKPFNDRSNKENKSTHTRTSSMQHEIGKDRQGKFKKQDYEEETKIANKLIEEIEKLRIQNENLHRIYDQSNISLKFKSAQCLKFQAEYKCKVNQVQKARKQAERLKIQEEWCYNRVYSPKGLVEKRSGSK